MKFQKSLYFLVENNSIVSINTILKKLKSQIQASSYFKIRIDKKKKKEKEINQKEVSKNI